MQAMAADVDAGLTGVLPGFTFADAYRVPGAVNGISARNAATAIFETSPAWVSALMSTRNRMVGLFGLKAGRNDAFEAGQAHIGIFPVLAESPEKILLGLDDHHLDFRIVVTVYAAEAKHRQVTVTTIVKTHNALGRVYLAAVMPFHRLIARHMLDHAAKAWNASWPPKS